MNWLQQIDPLHNFALPAPVASIRIAFILWALIVWKMKGYMASLHTIIVYGMLVKLVILSMIHGAVCGLFPIRRIIIGLG